jgi:hypothetical protein
MRIRIRIPYSHLNVERIRIPLLVRSDGNLRSLVYKYRPFMDLF